MKLDTTDRRILRETQRLGQVSNVELAKRVGLSESPCLRRVRRLENEGIIKGYSVTLDHRKLGLNIVSWIQVNVDQRSEADSEAFQKAVLQESAIIECYALTGDCDYLLKVMARDLDEFGELTMHRILRFPGVKNITSGFVLNAIKEHGVLPL
jgi:Lrp/AsnC family leucine-responsive transcriptional regulator